MLPGRNGSPSVECRDLDLAQCEIGFSVIDDERAGSEWEPRDVDRVVVSCVGTCTARGGETRLDVVLLDGTSVLWANGAYGEFEQSCA